jgi:glutamate synthase domain-containing protein 3
VRWLIERHVELTGSVRGQLLLENWSYTAQQLWYVAPLDRVRRIEAAQAGRVSANV